MTKEEIMSQKTCMFWAQDRCRNGIHCKFMHARGDDKSEIEAWNNRFQDRSWDNKEEEPPRQSWWAPANASWEEP